MTIAASLQQFYAKNNFKPDGGENEKLFSLKFKLFSIKLPNFSFRKKVIYIHDIQHILYQKDTCWKGEAFIAGWEIGTKIWKHFPIGIMSLWAMGFSLLNYPKEVYKGYKIGINNKGIIDINLSKDEILNLSIAQLKSILQKDSTKHVNWSNFLFWSFTSILIFVFPFLLILVITFKYLF